MSAYPNLFEVLDENGAAIAQEIDRKSKVIIKETPTAAKKKEAPKKEEKKPDLKNEQATDGFEVKGQNRPPKQAKSDKGSPSSVPQASGRGGRGRGRGDRPPPRAEGDQAPRRQEGDARPPRAERPPRHEGEQQQDDKPRRERPPRREGDQSPQDADQPRRRERPPRKEGDQPRRPRENRPPRDNVNGEENPKPYRERRNFDGPRDNNNNEDAGERRFSEDRPSRGGRGGRGGRGRGFYANRASAENGHDLAEGAPVEAEEKQHRPPRRIREDKLTDEKGFVQPKQRAYERRSGTGRIDDTKRGGRGPNNWGGVNDELDAISEVAQEKAIDNEAAATDAAQAEGEAPAQTDAAKEAKQEEEKTITLKEYREAQEKAKAQIELPQPRQAEANDSWKNLKVLKKDELNLQLSVIAPVKAEKKKAPESKETAKTESPATKTKSRGSKVPVQDVLHIKAERQENKRRENEHRERAPKAKASAPAPATAPPAKNSQDFPALSATKN